QRADASWSGSPCTRKKSAGPLSTIRPASASPSSSPPRIVADASASAGFSPASTSDSTSHARWFARSDPPPKSVPVAIRTPARWASWTLSIARSRRRAVRSFPSSLTNRGNVVVCAEVAPVLELGRRGLQEGRAVIRLDQEATREDAAMANPCPRDADPRPSRVRTPPFSHPEREGPPPSIPRIDGERRAHVAGPAHTRAAQEIAVVLRDLEQLLRRIGPAVDPMRASREREVAVRIDHPR